MAVAFPTLGAHCSIPTCHQHDFLPFECDLCHQKFCLEHRTYLAHDCPEFKKKELLQGQVPICPLCSQPVPILPGEDPNLVVENHILNGCPKQRTIQERQSFAAAAAAAASSSSSISSFPSSSSLSSSTATTATATATATASSANSHDHCTFHRCKEKVLVRCRFCGGSFCLKHRLEADHQCSHYGDTKKKKHAQRSVGPFIIQDSEPSSQSSASTTTTTSKTSEGGRAGSAPKGSAARSNLKRNNEILASLRQQREQRQQQSSGTTINNNNNNTTASSDRTATSSHRGPSTSTAALPFSVPFSNKKLNPIGNQNIEFADRVFLDVYFPISSHTAPVHMFFSRNTSIGRTLDQIAQQGKISNRNNSTNTPSTERLNLFNLRTGECLPPNKLLKETDVEGMLRNNDSVILEYGDTLPPQIQHLVDDPRSVPPAEQQSFVDSYCSVQ